ncbi:MAG: sterol desaturase family protein [Ilumatobacteraceae bacterium]
MDLAAAATPLYIGSMLYENRKLKQRAIEVGPTPADYCKPDTTVSLAMGAASLIVPITQYLSGHIVPGKGRFGKVALTTVATAIAVTTVADRIVKSAKSDDKGQRLARRARSVAKVGGVAAIAGGGILLTASTGYISSVQRQWTKGKHRDLGTGVVAWTAAMVGWDFAYYWNHRMQHEIRAMWAIHVVHHSSEHFNLSTALRQPVASAFGVWVPYGAMARVGVRPELIEYSRGLNLIYQFWIHTDLVRSLGQSEAVLNTPSHHRVHHGSNGRYLDRNHAGILIVWDRLFGTFQRELSDHDPVVYGLTKNLDPPRGWSSLWDAMTHEYREMFHDIAESTTWTDRLSFTLRGPGWASARRAERENPLFARSPELAPLAVG